MGIKEKANGGKEEWIYMEGGKGKEIGEGQQGRGRKGREREGETERESGAYRQREVHNWICMSTQNYNNNTVAIHSQLQQ